MLKNNNKKIKKKSIKKKIKINIKKLNKETE
jgi:hypothetical protein